MHGWPKGLAVETPSRARREGAHGKAFEAYKDMRGRVGHIEGQKKTRRTPGASPSTVLEAVHVHNGDAVFLEFVEQIRDAPIFAVAGVHGTL